MKTYLHYIIFLGCCLFSISGTAQDVRFSQFYNTPLQVNPAMTGLFNGQFRAGVIYRDQWSSVHGSTPYRSYAASADTRLFVLKNDLVGLGINVLRDEAGTAGYAQTQVHLNGSFMKQIAGGRGSRSTQYLIAGAGVGVGQNAINWNSIRFSTQFDGIDYDPNMPSGELGGGSTGLYIDINAGLMWTGVFAKNKSLYFGGALNHVNAPNISFYDGRNEKLYMRLTFHGGAELPLGKSLSLLPNFQIIKQGPAFETDGGINLRYANKEWNDIALRAGVWGRIVGKEEGGFASDAFVMLAGLELRRWQFTFSYDVNTSTLSRVSNSQGALEVSLIYTHPPKRRGSIECPRF